ncbi:Phosphatidate phosphatase PAH2 [Bienertia sinuspersici]
MFAVGRIGSYISRGVCTVSAPFHPFGGAVDIIVVEQQDGSYKSTPWYVRFGKFQGVLKATERVVSINVNGVDADFHMYLDLQGEAFFLKEVDAAERESESYPSSADEMQVKPDVWSTQKSMSCNYEINSTNMSEIEGKNKKSLTRTNSHRGKVFGLPFGKRSMKENGFQGREPHVEMDSSSSLERAEIAADLLEVRWSTNLHTGKNQNISVSDVAKVDADVSYEDNISSMSGCVESVSNNEKIDAQFSCSIDPDNAMKSTLEKTYTKADLMSVRSNVSEGVDNGCINNDQNVLLGFSEVSRTVDCEKLEGSASSDDAPSNNRHDSLESNAKCNEETLQNTGDVHLVVELGNSHCSVDEKSTGDVIIKKEVEGIPLEESITQESCKSLTVVVNEPSSGEFSAGTNNLNSLPSISENNCSIANTNGSSHSVNAQDHIGHFTHGGDNRVRQYISKEEQFIFTDLDEPKVEKAEHNRTSSSGSEERLSQGSLESSEVALSDTIISDGSCQLTSNPNQDNVLANHPSLKMNSNRVSSPINIPKIHNDADEEALAPIAESLPNMLLDGGDLSINVSQPLGRSLDSTLEVYRMVNNDVPVASEMSGGQQQVVHSQLTTNSSQISEVMKKIISDPAVEVSLCRHLLFEGMGYEAAAHAFDAEKLDAEKFLWLGPDILENDKLVVRIGGLYFPWNAAMPIASAIGSPGKEEILEPKGMIAVGQFTNCTFEGIPQKSINSQSGSWKIWPFSFKRSNSIKSRNSSSDNSGVGPQEMAGTAGAIVPSVAKKKLRTKVPTSEQLASLNLKEGKNVVTFTFSTAMLGQQQVDARIFLWKWNARIVISDVDGTITKSDVLGQFMPMMGMDWSQTGVTHLFSAIKENGYQLLFLSARSISQAYHTRQFLINLKQDGKALPEGPVLISPDGLFPSLYREVIRRAPHEFKIACLEDVRVLFSPDHNPFYAGFGNRDTDELSYLKMGIPKGKIFTINPKGQVVVNRRVDSKSYTSLHTLVHDMFPPTTLHEQEDYNSWNFWRLPPPDGII